MVRSLTYPCPKTPEALRRTVATAAIEKDFIVVSRFCLAIGDCRTKPQIRGQRLTVIYHFYAWEMKLLSVRVGAFCWWHLLGLGNWQLKIPRFRSRISDLHNNSGVETKGQNFQQARSTTVGIQLQFNPWSPNALECFLR